MLTIILLVLVPIMGLSLYMMITGKGSFLVAGYNTMSKEMQKKYDAKALTKAVGLVVFLSMWATMIIICGILTKLLGVTILGVILTVFASVGGIAYLNIGNRFKIKQ